jgi:ABC-2 type transport system permease protein
VSQTRTALAATVKQFARTPVLVALLVVLPAYFVGLLGLVVPDAAVTASLPSATVATTLNGAMLPMLASLAAVMVTGIAGLFLTVDTLEADGWLALSGLPSTTLFGARAVALAGVAVLASVAAAATLSLLVPPEQPVVFLAATVVLALTYGLAGAVVGVALDRLAGVYVLLFGPAIDLFLLHSPLATDAPALAAAAPGRWAGVAAMDAALTTDPNWSALAVGVTYLTAVAVAASGAVWYAVRP